MDWEGFFTSYRKPGFIPGYEIVNKLGSGVFGEVYKARKESIGKFYAIKFLKVSDEKISEAVFKELDSLRYFAQIDHPNLVTIEDRGEVLGIPFIVMGYAGDETLKKRLAGGAMPPDTASEIFRQACAGVGALHRKSIIHFDLKPANIFMKGSHARVGDYGLSKLVSESHKTMSIGRGTPYYMAPEMLTRKGDHRSDIYSLGVILYEMLTGEVPFTGDSEWEVLKKHETSPVVVPSSVPSPFREVIMQCMAKRPEARPDSIERILGMLEGVATPRSVMPLGSASGSIPPPLPGRRGDLPVATVDLKSNLNEVVARIKNAGGQAARAARDAYQQRIEGKSLVIKIGADGVKAGRVGNGAMIDQMIDGEGKAPAPMRLDDSVYVDFDDPMPPEPGDAPQAKEAPKDISGPVEIEALHRPNDGRIGFWSVITWPIVTVAKVIGWFFSSLGRGIAVFFSNFLRYALVLGITVGLAALIHQALRNFDGGGFLSGW